MKTVKRLTLPCPFRDWYKTKTGLWASRPWSKTAKKEAEMGGGWFPPFHSRWDFEIAKELS